MTNFATLRKSVKRLEELEKWQADGIFNVLSKKEVSRLSKEMARLKKVLTGIRHLSKVPDVLFVIDPVEEDLAVAEGRRLNIPIVAVCDTDCNPDFIDHPIPGNDDAARSIKLFCGIIADAVAEGRAAYEASKTAVVAQAESKMLEGEPAAEISTPQEPQAVEEGMSAEKVS
ncbi:MAG: 30S ribosomal protein S2 [Elusimicrobia bacterium RIFCSPHIGHO2_02_FULL_57_9]|nr:MAG: 30S ribosomal protein S2 [Elusimicrobia bacterium RIFCSPHIGHO2_02_FULL_57_9]